MSAQIACPKCREYVGLPWEGPPPDLSDQGALDRIALLLLPRVIAECPDHSPIQETP